MKVKDYVKELLDDGKTDEEIIEALKQGNGMKGINPQDPRFTKIIFNRLKKKFQENK